MITLDRKQKTSLYEQLYGQLKEDIISGKLEGNTPLKSLRALEKGLGVSRTTIDRAYQQLVAEGYVRSVHGAGYFVEDIRATKPDATHETSLSDWNFQSLTTDEEEVIKYDFSHQGVEPKLFPWNKWQRALTDTIGFDSFNTRSTSEDSKGTRRLRENLAQFLYHHRGVNCVPEQIVVCSSTESAIEIILSLLDRKTHSVACEEPGFYPARFLIESMGFQTVSIPVLPDGLSINTLKQSSCNVAYVTPSYQFPTGAITPIDNRNLLLKWATKNNAYIIENDHYSSFCDGNMATPSLQSLDKFQNVIYMGSLSMVLPSSLCCAYVVLPFELLKKYEQRYQYVSPLLPSYHELALAQFYETGVIESQIRKMGVVNKKKQELLCNWITEHPSSGIDLMEFSSATHILTRIAYTEDQGNTLKRLKSAGVKIYDVQSHCSVQANCWNNMFILGYSILSEGEMIEGCELMASVLSGRQ